MNYFFIFFVAVVRVFSLLHLFTYWIPLDVNITILRKCAQQTNVVYKIDPNDQNVCASMFGNKETILLVLDDENRNLFRKIQ